MDGEKVFYVSGRNRGLGIHLNLLRPNNVLNLSVILLQTPTCRVLFLLSI